jgi:hypothetical protein
MPMPKMTYRPHAHRAWPSVQKVTTQQAARKQTQQQQEQEQEQEQVEAGHV